jgi:hypothetical protein
MPFLDSQQNKCPTESEVSPFFDVSPCGNLYPDLEVNGLKENSN